MDMKTILYTFADGHKEELEVTDEVAEVFYELEKYEQKVNRKETRRHVSLDMLEEAGFEFADPESDIEIVWEKQEAEERENELAWRECERLEQKQKWLESRLTARQAQAYFKFKYFVMKKVDIAKEMGVTEGAVRKLILKAEENLEKLRQQAIEAKKEKKRQKKKEAQKRKKERERALKQTEEELAKLRLLKALFGK
mgnify:CR=1 FL=1